MTVPYTLAKFGFWVAVAAAVGAWFGWMLRGVGRAAPAEPAAPAEDPSPADDAAPTNDTELARLRVRVSYLEPRAAQAEHLRRQLDELRAEAAAAATADDTWPVDLPLPGDAQAAEYERLSNVVANYQAENGELRARLWNSDAQVRELRALLSRAAEDGKLEE